MLKSRASLLKEWIGLDKSKKKKNSNMPLTIDQQKFYEHLQQSHPDFFSRKDNESHPELAHLKTPADRYKNMCENYKAPKYQKK